MSRECDFRQEVEHLLSAAQSPAQLRSALDEVDHLLATKQAQWGEQLKAVSPKSHSAPATPVRMKFPDGSEHDVSPEKLEKAKLKGGVPVNG